MLVNAAPPALPPLAALRRVGGITVNTVHGNERTIAAVRERFHPDVESMEGAAFMYASLVAGVPFAQVRAVSNVVERRNRGAWKIEQAIDALGERAVSLLESA
jgi:futalosine hydrolase